MKRLKGPVLFALALVPVAVAGGYFTAVYQLEVYGPALVEEAVAQLGSINMLKAVSVLQAVGYTLFCGLFGRVLAEKTGLWKPLRFEKPALLGTLWLSLLGGILFSLDWWTFGAVIPGIREATAAGLTFSGWMAGILYGGILEEVMLRLFVQSLIAWLLWRIILRKKEVISGWAAVTANVTAALLFAAGHLPATGVIFGELTPLILLRCFLLNGGFGLLFGWLYRKHGIQYSMLSHALLHVVSKLILSFA